MLHVKNKNFFEEKLKRLIQREQKRLKVYVIEAKESDNKNVHILAKRESDGVYCVWTSLYTGKVDTSYVGFYNGEYTPDLMEAISEYTKRVRCEKEQKIVAIIDKDGHFITHYYDITNMTGEVKDYYTTDDEGNNYFESYDDYEHDMIKRGAIPIEIIEHEI